MTLTMRLKTRIPVRISSWVAILSFALFIARFSVLFAESWSLVRSERSSDASLLEMCSRGMADESAKFRALCIRTKAEQAAPLLLKAILRAIRTAFADFVEMFQTPTRVVLLLVFCLSGLALPIVKAVSAVVAAHAPRSNNKNRMVAFSNGDEDQESCSVVVLKSERSNNGIFPNLRDIPRRVARRHPVAIVENDCGWESDDDNGIMKVASFH